MAADGPEVGLVGAVGVAVQILVYFCQVRLRAVLVAVLVLVVEAEAGVSEPAAVAWVTVIGELAGEEAGYYQVSEVLVEMPVEEMPEVEVAEGLVAAVAVRRFVIWACIALLADLVDLAMLQERDLLLGVVVVVGGLLEDLVVPVGVAQRDQAEPVAKQLTLMVKQLLGHRVIQQEFMEQ